MENTSDYTIQNIIKDFKNLLKSKNDAFALLLRLKQSLEFNATIDWHKLYLELSNLYKDSKPYYQAHTYTPDPIDPNSMTENDIFVFGSNTEGLHRGGAARAAVNDYGAIMGQATGLQGNSYAIITLDYTGNIEITLETIEKEIKDFFAFAIENQDKTFWVTKIGCGISGYEIKDIASLFKNKIIPPNVILPEEFVNSIMYEEYVHDPINEIYYHIISFNKVIAVKTKENQMYIVEKEMNLNLLGSIINSSKEDFINATETVIKVLYNGNDK